MRFSRSVSVALASVGLLVLPGIPYAAADTTVVIKSPAEFDDPSLPYGLFQSSCTTPGAPVPADWFPKGIFIEKGPDPVPSGMRTWGFDFKDTPNGGAIGPYQFHDDIGSVTTAQADFYAEGTGTATGVAFVAIATGDVNGDFWIGLSPLSIPSGSWQTESAIGLTYSWGEINGGGQVVGSSPDSTVADMLTLIDGGDLSGDYGIFFGCNSPGLVHFDKAQFGPDGDVTTYDFETAPTKTLIAASPRKVTAGKPVTLVGLMTDVEGGLFQRETLSLQARPSGGTEWKTIGHAKEHLALNGTEVPAVLKERPMVATQYRWVYAGGESAPGSTSKALTIQVRTAVTAKPSSKTVRKGGTITVTGKVSPKKAHKTITLLKGPKKIGSVRTKANGSYTVKVKANTSGAWKLHTAIGATKGNLAGKSRTFTVQVGTARAGSPTHARQPGHRPAHGATNPRHPTASVPKVATSHGLRALARFRAVLTIAP